jgi:hypothetical protein
MRKLLTSTVGGALALVPVTAFAATDDARDVIEAGSPLTTTNLVLRPFEAEAPVSQVARALRVARDDAERKERRDRRRAERRRARAQASAPTPVSPALEAIAACESGGNPRAIGGGGAYRGKYQFSYSTWASVGGSGDPAAAPEAEQDRRAAMLYARAGSSPWPVCG